MDAAGTVTAVRKLTSIATEAGGELWSPDGKNILFTSDVYPECDGAPDAEADTATREKSKRPRTRKSRRMIFDRLLYRHWNAYKEGKRTHIFVSIPVPSITLRPVDESFSFDEAGPRDLTPGDYDAPRVFAGRAG